MSADTVVVAAGLRPYGTDGAAGAHSLDLDVLRGRIVCLVGPSGSGKTTWLRVLAGVDAPAAGSLHILNADVSTLDAPSWRRLRCRAAFIAAGAPLLSVVNALDNVMLPALYHRLGTPDAIRMRAQETLEFLGYVSSTDVLPAYLSQHQCLLLAIARCLMLSPQLLFLDEPFHMADDIYRRREAEIYRRLARERNMTIFVATHHLGFVKHYADDIVFIHADGVWQFSGWQVFMKAPLPQVRAFLDVAA